MEIIPLQALLDRETTRPPDLVGGGVLGYQAFTLITGPAGVGKSLFVMQLALAITGGVPFLGFPITRSHRVLLVQKELSEEELKLRARRQLHDKRAPVDFFIAPDTWDFQLLPSGGTTSLDTGITTLRPEVIILDPMTEFSTIDENDASQLKACVLIPIRRWMAAGASVILVHHHGKVSEQAPKHGLSLVRGTSALAGAADTNLQLTCVNRDRQLYRLEFAKLRRWAAQTNVPLIFNGETLTFHIHDVAAAVMCIVLERPGITQPQLVTELASIASESTVRWHVDNLLSRSLLIEEAGAPPFSGRGRPAGRLFSPKSTNSLGNIVTP